MRLYLCTIQITKALPNKAKVSIIKYTTVFVQETAEGSVLITKHSVGLVVLIILLFIFPLEAKSKRNYPRCLKALPKTNSRLSFTSLFNFFGSTPCNKLQSSTDLIPVLTQPWESSIIYLYSAKIVPSSHKQMKQFLSAEIFFQS